ncbi:MAG: hypothetical protein ACR2LK_01035 [Solirubrobacteraceae bacterium]
MLVIDASALFETLTDGPCEQAISERIAADPEQAAAQILDAVLVTTDRRPATAGGPRCEIETF